MIHFRNTGMVLSISSLVIIACVGNGGVENNVDTTEQASESVSTRVEPSDIPVEDRWDVPPESLPPPQLSEEVLSLIEGLDGDVGIQMLVTADGIVDTAWVEYPSGHSVLDSVALMQAYTLTFTPAKKNGEPIDVYILWPFQFRAL